MCGSRESQEGKKEKQGGDTRVEGGRINGKRISDRINVDSKIMIHGRTDPTTHPRCPSEVVSAKRRWVSG